MRATIAAPAGYSAARPAAIRCGMANDVDGALAAWRERHARRAWKPLSNAFGLGAAQFGGSPVLAPGEAWPACGTCKQPMQFLVQLDLAALPDGAPVKGAGLLQLFYCSTDDGRCETWAPFSGTHVVRLLSGPTEPAAHPPAVEPYPRKRIVGWQEIVDYPDPEEPAWIERTAHGLDADDDDDDDDDGAEDGDKLGGWPAWVQGVEYPSCRECGATMELVLQVDSNDNLPIMFGDVGCGHVTQCPAHPHVLAFGWACG